MIARQALFFFIASLIASSVLGQLPPVQLAPAPAPVAGGDCISIGSSLLTDCQAEQRIADAVYPLSSTVPATPEQIQAGTAQLQASNLPTKACCTTASSFKAANCIADPTIQAILPTVGVAIVGAESLLSTLLSACPPS